MTDLGEKKEACQTKRVGDNESVYICVRGEIVRGRVRKKKVTQTRLVK